MISLEEAIWGSETSVENPKKNEGDRVDTNFMTYNCIEICCEHRKSGDGWLTMGTSGGLFNPGACI